MTPESEPLAELLRRYDRPVAPSPAFAATLRARFRAELAAAPEAPKAVVQMQSVAQPLPGRPAAPAARRGSPWRTLLHAVAAAGLLVALIGGGLLGRALWPGMTAFFQAPDDRALASVPMRGADPGRTNVNPGPAPAGRPGLLWSVSTGAGAHSPIVVDGTVYLATDAGEVIAFDRASGAERWRVLVGGTDTPTYADGVIYVSSLSLVANPETGKRGGELVALDATSGEERWRADTGAVGGASPVVVGDTVYAGGDQEVYAFDAATGGQRWVATLAAAPCACMLPALAVADGRVFATPGGTQQARLFALDAATGEELWRFDGAQSQFFTDPVVANGFVYLSESAFVADNDTPVASRTGLLLALDAASGEIAWSIAVAPGEARSALYRSFAGPPAVTSDALYFVSFESQNTADLTATLRALDPLTGEPRWAAPVAASLAAVPVAVDDLVIVPGVQSERYDQGFGAIRLLAYEAGSGVERWRVDLDGSSYGPPAVLGGTIFVATFGEGVLYALSEAGTPLAGASPEAADASPQALAAGTTGT